MLVETAVLALTATTGADNWYWLRNDMGNSIWGHFRGLEWAGSDVERRWFYVGRNMHALLPVDQTVPVDLCSRGAADGGCITLWVSLLCCLLYRLEIQRYLDYLEHKFCVRAAVINHVDFNVLS